MDIIFATFPIFFLIIVMAMPKGLPADKALPFTAVITYFIKYFYFDLDFDITHAAVINGLITAFTPIAIVFGAIFLFQVFESSGSLKLIKKSLNRISENKMAQVMIIGWTFSFLLEGASGFGTPAAIVAPILVGLGFKALNVAIFALIMNTIPVSFGAVGTPIWFGLGELSLSTSTLIEISKNTAKIQFFASLFIPFIALRFLFSDKEIKKNIVFILFSILSCSLPYLILAHYSVEFPSLAGGAIGLILTILLSKLFYKNRKLESVEKIKFKEVFVGTFPLFTTLLLLLVTRLEFLGVKSLLQTNNPNISFDLLELGTLSISPTLVITISNILKVTEEIGQFSLQLLYIPFILPFIAVGLIHLIFITKRPNLIKQNLYESLQKIKGPSIALIGALIFVKLMMVEGRKEYQLASIQLIGESLANLTGPYWQYVSVYLGALGSFFSGSAAVSALTFSGIQNSIALRPELSLNREMILALQSVGGAMGNMACIHNIVAVCSVIQLQKKEAHILGKTILPLLFYGVIAIIVSFYL